MFDIFFHCRINKLHLYITFQNNFFLWLYSKKKRGKRGIEETESSIIAAVKPTWLEPLLSIKEQTTNFFYSHFFYDLKNVSLPMSTLYLFRLACALVLSLT